MVGLDDLRGLVNLNYSAILFFEGKQNPCLYETLWPIGTGDSALRIISQIQELHGYWQGVSRACLSSDRKDCLSVALTAAVITCMKEDKQGTWTALGSAFNHTAEGDRR